MTEKKTYYTSRSATISYQKCNRSRYLTYHHLGTGIVKNSLYLPFVVGSAVHKGLEELLKGVMDSPYNQEGLPLDTSAPVYHEMVQSACEAARGEFLRAVESSPYDLSVIEAKQQEKVERASTMANDPFAHIPSMEGANDPISDYILYLTQEQQALVEVMVAGYAFSEQGLKLLLRDYEVLEVEQEDSFLMGETDEWKLVWESRADGLLRRRLDDALVVLSFKTASKVDGRTTTAGESDMQGMSEVVAIEKRLARWAESAGGALPHWFTKLDISKSLPHVEAVQMIHLVKGSQSKDASGFERQENSLLRPWVRRGAFGDGDDWRFAGRYKRIGPRGGEKWETLGSSYTRVNIWEEAQKLGCEVFELMYAFSQAIDDETGVSPLDKWIVNPNVHRREPEVLERWLRQTSIQEMRIADRLYQIETGKAQLEEALDDTFSLTGSGANLCAYFSGGFHQSKCPHFDCCWNSRYYFDSPLESGFKQREANHPLEKEKLNENSK